MRTFCSTPDLLRSIHHLCVNPVRLASISLPYCVIPQKKMCVQARNYLHTCYRCAIAMCAHYMLGSMHSYSISACPTRDWQCVTARCEARTFPHAVRTTSMPQRSVPVECIKARTFPYAVRAKHTLLRCCDAHDAHPIHAHICTCHPSPLSDDAKAFLSDFLVINQVRPQLYSSFA